MNAEKIIEKAKVSLLLSEVFFGSLALNLKYVSDPRCRTAWTDGTYLGYNPQFIESLEFNVVKALIAHEVMHCVCAHQSRMQGRNHKKWNQAADYAINLILRDSGFTLGDGWLLSHAYNDMSAEKIYAVIPDPPQVGGGFSCGGGGSGGGSGSESETQSQGDDDQDEGPGGIRPAPVDAKNGQTQAEAGRQSEIDWKTRAKQAAQQAKACGKLPGSLRHMVDSLTDHSINWQEELRNFLVDVIAKDYSWRLPNKRYISSGAYLPSISYGYDLAKAMCYLDASGSVMYDADVPRRFAAEMTSLLEEFQNIELTCRYFDTRVQDHTLTFGGSDLPVKFELYNIGGGTDFRPIFKDIKNFEEPKFLIIFTDLEVSSSDYPKVQPDFPVLWCCTTDLVAPWGKTIRIK